MNLQELAQIGEFLVGLGVLLTLIYLAIQIREKTRAVKSASAQETHDTLIDGYFRIAHDQDMNRIFRVGTQDPDELTEVEVGQLC